MKAETIAVAPAYDARPVSGLLGRFDPPAHTVVPLFEPFTLGTITLRNRFVMAPMTRCHSPGGVPGPAVRDYYRRRAEAAVGLIITEGIGVDHPAALGVGTLGEDHMPVLHGAEALAGWREVVQAVHAAGGTIFPQLWHQGPVRRAGSGPQPATPSCRPSGIWGPEGGSTTTLPDYLAAVRAETAPMTERDIEDVIAGFARSAANARAVGFDGIAIHGAHGYLIDSFLWDQTNRRADYWGGSISNRARFAVEIVKAVRASAPGLPIMFRFSQWKLQDYDGCIASNPAELEAVLGPLADAGVDIFDASTRVFAAPAFAGSPLSLAGWATAFTGLPTMAGGGIGLDKELRRSFSEQLAAHDNLADAARRIATGEFALAGIGRSLMTDAAWVQKIRAGKPFKLFTAADFATLD